MNKETLKKILPYLIAIVTFIVLALAYCSPIMDGQIINSGDTRNWQGMAQEAREFNASSDHNTLWTNSMFGGMPTYQITMPNGSITSSDALLPLSKVTRLGFLSTLAIFIGYFLGFFIMLRSFKINKWLAIIGSIALALSSYFIIIIAAGHNTKADAIGLLAPVIGGFYLIFNRKYWLGAILTMVYMALGAMQHPQMTFYIFMLIGVLFFAELYIHIREKRWKDLGLGIAVFAVSVLVGIGTGYTRMQLNREYVKETMRGGHSELVKADDATNKTSGLDLDYATQWSYGIDETMTLMIPNFKGGASDYSLGENSGVYNELIKNGVPRKSAADFCKNVPTYWGDQPFTSGPVYVGAIICFLFLLGLLIVKGPYKWALLTATIFSILLAWGHNFMPFTKFFFNYFPMYDKFRTVSSILVVAEITMPLLGFLALKEIMEGNIDKKKLLNRIYISAGITAGICLIFALLGGSFFNFNAANDAQYAESLPDWLLSAIVAERATLLKMSAWRSFAFIVLAAGLLWLYVKEKVNFAVFASILGVLVLIDMWTVDRHYLNNDNFVSARADKNYFKMQPYEESIKGDTDPNFRVLNMSTNTFNDSRTSYYFKSIGGYHAAKLRRYQDMIEYQIQPDMQTAFNTIAKAQGSMRDVDSSEFEILNMLNTKYMILPSQDGQGIPIPNPYRFGNAWFVDSLVVANTPNEEMDALDKINLRNCAVFDAKFKSNVQNMVPGHDSTASVTLTSYKPDCLEYDAVASKPGTIVFSEIYYPYGWHAYIDGQPVEHFRANYTLRALNMPAGNHKIRFEFKPDTIKKSEPIALTCVAIVYLTIIGGILIGIRKCIQDYIDGKTDIINSPDSW